MSRLSGRFVNREGAYARNGDFSGANLRRVIADGTGFSSAGFKGAKISLIQIEKTQTDQTTIFPLLALEK